MPRVQLYIAQSLDGKIAKPDGSLDWLNSFPMPEGEDFGYGSFYEGVTHLCMGRTTYQEVLSFGVDWPYTPKPVAIFTSNPNLETPTPETSVWSSGISEYLECLPKDAIVWLVGGGSLIADFLKNKSVDDFIITTLPRIIGAGIPLFQYDGDLQDFELDKVDTFPNGIVNSYYSRK
ncbi:MAG: dihydrofolate reductase family protein [Schleiferiaceae bacterium]